jgi:hypothetical protein
LALGRRVQLRGGTVYGAEIGETPDAAPDSTEGTVGHRRRGGVASARFLSRISNRSRCVRSGARCWLDLDLYKAAAQLLMLVGGLRVGTPPPLAAASSRRRQQLQLPQESLPQRRRFSGLLVSARSR